jgi:hypothetical protein
MALHDYKRIIDTYPNRAYVTVEVATDQTIEIGMLDDSGVRAASIRMQKHDAGLVLDAIAGAIRVLEGLA